MRAAAFALLATTASLAGCAHRMQVSSNPAGAYVSVDDARLGVTPLEVRVPRLGARTVHIELLGYRPLDVRLACGFLAPRCAVELRLVREHGGAGTWEPEDVR